MDDIYCDDMLTIEADHVPDEEWGAEESHVVLHVRVMWGGEVLAEGSLGGVEHGWVTDEIETDAMEWTPATIEGNTIVMGSPLFGLAAEVMDLALRHVNGFADVSSRDMRKAVSRAMRFVEPINLSWIEAAHARALHENDVRS